MSEKHSEKDGSKRNDHERNGSEQNGDKRNGSNAASSKALTLANMNPRIRQMEYAVRGPIVARATAIQRGLQDGTLEKPYDKVVRCNIGDCHATGQKPITFLRQVLAICCDPSLTEAGIYPPDAVDRAQRVLNSCYGQSVGAYSDSVGLRAVRQDVATYIEQRDGLPSNEDEIYLTTGASSGIKSVLSLMITGNPGSGRGGVMIPIPQYPLYTATLVEYDLCPIPYYLDEDKNWALNIDELERAIAEARESCIPRAIVVINPGNPTGQVLSEENVRDVVRFAWRHGLLILADEVYQHNIYATGSAFYSFKKVLKQLGDPFDKVELASFMSCSKGYMGECGLRAGYLELINIDSKVRDHFKKSLSASLCSSVVGQAAMECVVNPPRLGEPSYDLHQEEKKKVLSDLATKAQLVTDLFNSMPGITCRPVQGAMYCFPQLHLPAGAIEEAKRRQQAPDAMYAFELLEQIGLCVVPGSGFGQRQGTSHFRMTILPPVDEIRKALNKFADFHQQFMERYK